MSGTYNNIGAYLSKHFQCESRTIPKTHTSLGGRKGAWHVPDVAQESFYEHYVRAVRDGESLHITEAHREVGPVLLDFDFRFKREEADDSVPARKYTDDHVRQILEAYFGKLSEYVDCRGARAFVMEKPGPRVEKTLIKDGIHIVVPDVVTTPALQYLLREKCMPLMEPIFRDIDICNQASDCFDEAVIQNNNWLMAFSSKEGQPPYAVTRVMRWDGSSSFEKDTVPTDPAVLVPLLSIRNKTVETPVVEGRAAEIEAFSSMRKSKRVAKTFASTQLNESHEYEFAVKLMSLLSGDRADSYATWVRVGWCLRNIDHRMLSDWITFSMKSRKFRGGECEALWSTMKVGNGLGIGSLRLWAREDDPEGYKLVVSTDLSELVMRARTGTHYDVACVVHRMYCMDFVCASIRTKSWYEFRGHRWHYCEQGMSLSKRLSVEVYQVFMQKVADLSREAANCGTAEDEGRQKAIQSLTKVATNLKHTEFKRLIMVEMSALFYDQHFEERLDSKCHLVAFDNGVFDLDAMEFRDGAPEDAISFSTGIRYESALPDSHEYRSIQTFFKQVLPKPAVREYVLMHLASCLNGSIREERFHIWTGGGSNGKSVLIGLFEKSFGDYCCKFPVALLTNKRAASNAATSEIVRAKGRRFACLQEPSENERFNVGLMKELTGGDKIIARGLYKEPVEFKPQFKMVLTANHLPEVTACDNGTWRRIRVIEFLSRFSLNPNPKFKETEHLMDPDLSSKMDGWREQFMAMLLEYYAAYKKQGVLREPEEVLQCTREYQESNDTVKQFLAECVERLEEGSGCEVSTSDLYSRYKDQLQDDGRRVPPKKEFVQMLRPHGLLPNNQASFRNVRLREPGSDSFRKDEDNV
jgi:P4 family phage/plasmid primase-like protien